MDIHKPKPIRNWREFLKEYAIIVIGVLTALAAEQAAEALHWHTRVQDAVTAMRLELGEDDAPQAYTRAAATVCFEQQMDAIQAAIEQNRSRTEITALIARFAPPERTWDGNAWDSVQSSGVAAHFPPQEMLKWANLYVAIPLARASAMEENADLVALRPIRQSGETLSTSEADTMLAALGRLRNRNHIFGRNTAGWLGNLAQSGIVISPQQQSRILGDLRALYGNCVRAPAPVAFDPNDQIGDITRSAMAPAGGTKP